MPRRFWISLVLAVPVIAFSSLGALLLGGRMPPDWDLSFTLFNRPVYQHA